MVWAAALVLAAGVTSFDLDCDGGRAVLATSAVTSGAVITTEGNGASGRVVTSEPTYISFKMRIVINGDGGEVRFPDGSSGKLKKVAITEDAIDAKYSSAWLTTHTIHIDRHSGDIMTSGGYQGRCKAHEDAPKAF